MKSYCDRCKKIDQQSMALVDINVGVIHLTTKDASREFWRAVGGFPKNLSLCETCYVEFFYFKNDNVGEKSKTDSHVKEELLELETRG